jgi:hypothetical protein
MDIPDNGPASLDGYEDDRDFWDGDDDPYDEPVGSCEECGTNLYVEDDQEYCDQCLWRIHLNG